jgi:hypothetical protein
MSGQNTGIAGREEGMSIHHAIKNVRDKISYMEKRKAPDAEFLVDLPELLTILEMIAPRRKAKKGGRR